MIKGEEKTQRRRQRQIRPSRREKNDADGLEGRIVEVGGAWARRQEGRENILNKANRHKSRAPSKQRPTDRRTSLLGNAEEEFGERRGAWRNPTLLACRDRSDVGSWSWIGNENGRKG